ncbi:MAG: preprotein translocase subunit YajC [Candidatus Omnitrophica bacterium CG_4_8_14_3_um_filter_43_15]|nr:MAG: preprotein translocase subunit YajC [Candidatus Omnitrophica bacterium CG1_02_43_210]PIR65689.1 MAG: preprotein translocase subunit YajC [Candidatus Omnitrophica bacterium CG10_big_fil_rev_8_21_14_0_10_43_8]PIW80644.1 MAG: preprotein translocase subunit YajC [Candidatus Omnitrophica bacterium CG_4_8_14_3_um_filter_43_15]PIY84396.1 MAG: preprotein translocase subunit YajC [Candidatus Omnitrophica bacterium CG_4_10_14_0_8_um_filter_43_18]PJC45920.1 MAG: preprotein translocase subunit YajC
MTQQAAPVWANFVPIILIFGIFYFLLIKPQQDKQKQHVKMVSELKKNDEVVTAGGIHGVVVNVKDTSVVVKVDDNVKIDVEKTHISQVTKK